jgi:hypothetical protein
MKLFWVYILFVMCRMFFCVLSSCGLAQALPYHDWNDVLLDGVELVDRASIRRDPAQSFGIPDVYKRYLRIKLSSSKNIMEMAEDEKLDNIWVIAYICYADIDTAIKVENIHNFLP